MQTLPLVLLWIFRCAGILCWALVLGAAVLLALPKTRPWIRARIPKLETVIVAALAAGVLLWLAAALLSARFG